MLEALRIRNYALTTVSSYIRSVAEFEQHFDKPPDQLGSEENSLDLRGELDPLFSEQEKLPRPENRDLSDSTAPL
jgi:hypothetical protein